MNITYTTAPPAGQSHGHAQSSASPYGTDLNDESSGLVFLSRKCRQAIRCSSGSALQLVRLLEACDDVVRFSTVARRDRPYAKAAIARFLPATVIEWRSGETWLAWLAEPHEPLAQRNVGEFEAAAVAAVVSGIHFVVVTNRHLSLVNRDDLERANDVRHRQRRGLVDPLFVTEDDVFADEVERQVRRAFAAALAEAPSTDVCQRLGLPMGGDEDVAAGALSMSRKAVRTADVLGGLRAVGVHGRLT